MILPAAPDSQPRVLHDLLRQAAESSPNQDLLFVHSSSRDRTVVRRTYAWLATAARRLARALNELELHRGSVVVVYLSEHEDNMVAIWACLLAGLVPCLQPALSAHEKHRSGHIGHIQTLFSSPLWLISDSGVDQLKSVEGLNYRVLGELRQTTADAICSKEWTTLERGEHASPEDEALLFLTSGSTGFSKAAVHTHQTVLEACFAKGDDYRLDEDSRTLNCERLHFLLILSNLIST
jgi:acyl-CoA synthetase (AMP-forming)/AMP-acid ligase II